jgi:ribosomal protein S12 methylthiotransferase accessory factor
MPGLPVQTRREAVRVFDGRYTARKIFRDGTHRTCSPAETWARWRPMAAHFGITRVANLTGLDIIGVPVFTAVRPNSRSLATSQGKALDAEAARTSAYMEAVEFWHAERVRLPVRIDSVQGLQAQRRLIDVDGMARYRAVDRSAQRAWVTGFDVMAGEECLVPFEAVSLNRVVPPTAITDFHVSSNGLASGNHLLEAMAHGLYEVIERDASTLWRLSNDVRLVDLGAVRDAGCAEMIARVERAGSHVAAWNITSDVGVPTFSAAIVDAPGKRMWRQLGVYYGVGTHLDPTVALSRALSEAIQSRLGFISGSRDDLFRSRHRRMRNEEFVRQVWAEIQSVEPTVRPDRLRSLATPTFEGDIGVILASLRRVGSKSCVVVDLTDEALGIPVVKVIVPGLEGMGAGELPGRRARRLLARAQERS